MEWMNWLTERDKHTACWTAACQLLLRKTLSRMSLHLPLRTQPPLCIEWWLSLGQLIKIFDRTKSDNEADACWNAKTLALKLLPQHAVFRDIYFVQTIADDNHFIGIVLDKVYNFLLQVCGQPESCKSEHLQKILCMQTKRTCTDRWTWATDISWWSIFNFRELCIRVREDWHKIEQPRHVQVPTRAAMHKRATRSTSETHTKRAKKAFSSCAYLTASPPTSPHHFRSAGVHMLSLFRRHISVTLAYQLVNNYRTSRIS